MLEKLARPEVLELIEEGDRETLSDFLNRWVPPDLAGLIASLDDEPQVFVLESLSPALAAATFVYLDLPSQERLLNALPQERAAEILNDMAPDDRTALLEELPRADADRLLAEMSPEASAIARKLLQYPEDTIGRLMTPDYLAIRKDWTIKRVLDHVRTHGRKSETLGVLYVVDQDGKLVDDIGMGKFLLAPLHTHVHELMNSQFVGLKVTDDKRTAVEVFRKYDRTALPVVDVEGHLVGIVTIDDVLDVAEEEATRELQQFGGVEALDAPYIATPFFELVRKRASWLVVLFLGEMLTATAMGFFEREIEKAVVLALFVPLIISSGGNSGSQAATLIIRALALGEVTLRDWWRVMRRELASGLMLGLILGTIGFVRIAAWSAFSTIYGPHWFLVAITVGFSLIGIVLWGTLSGAMRPFALRKLGFDPATSSAPFVATLVDVTGLVIYFTVALFVLHGTLL
jgi:magnesium transporter